MNETRQTSRVLLLLAGLATIAAMAILRAVLEPLMIAIFLSFVAMPFLRAGRRMRIPGPVLVVAVVAILLVVLGWAISLVYYSLADFLVNVPDYEAQLRPRVVEWLERFDFPTTVLPPADQGIPWRRIFTSTPIAGYAGSGLGDFLGWSGELLVVLTFLVFILLDRADGALDRRILKAFADEDGGDQVAHMLEEINRDIERYLLVKAGISLLTGFLMAMVLTIFGVPFAVLFGAVAFVLNFIPNIGSLLATVPPLVVAFAQHGSAWEILPLIIILVSIQATIGNFLDPWLMGRSLRLSPTTVLFSLILWNWLWGIPGMVLAVPMAVVTRIILLRVPDLRYLAMIMSDEDPDRDEVGPIGGVELMASAKPVNHEHDHDLDEVPEA